MATIRHFLGWSEPALPRAARWLLETHGADLSNHHCVLPTARNGRRFLELLTSTAEEHAGRQPLAPPVILTPGQLPDLMIEHPADAPPLACPFLCRLAQLECLRSLAPEVLQPLVPDRPAENDFSAWWFLADRLETLRETLAADGLSWVDLLQRIQQGQLDLMQPDRYATLAALDEAFEEKLAAWQRSSPASREPALRPSDQPLMLLGVSDLNPQILDLLTRSAHAGRPMTALVFAPESEAAGFGPLGELQPTYWLSRPIPVRNEQLRFVDGPADQATVATEVIAACGAENPDQISLVLGDERMAPLFRRTLEAAGAPTRGAGTPADQSPPARLFAALARFHRSRAVPDLRALLAHPTAEAALQRSLNLPVDPGPLMLIDDLLNRAPLSTWLQESPDDPGARSAFETIRSAQDYFLHELAARAADHQPLKAWARPLARSLAELWDPRPLQPHLLQDQFIRAGLEAIATTLHEWENLPSEADRPLHSWEAITLLLSQLQDRRLPEPTDHAAIEVIGPLELPLDDAPFAVFACLNEGQFPASDHADPFLPESLRRNLRLSGSDRRLARDSLLLIQSLASRSDLTLICGRQNLQGDPLRPSRLLLTCDARTQTLRLAAFCDKLPKNTPSPQALAHQSMVQQTQDLPHRVFWSAVGAASSRQPTSAQATTLILPPPMAPVMISRLSVTAFRDYLACPYRFYLKHVLKLQPVIEQPPELSASAFGDLAHAVLADFGQSEQAGSDNPQTIVQFLDHLLDHHARRRLSLRPPPAAAIQIEQLRFRLHAFAQAQVRTVREGWRIRQVEVTVQRTIHVDDQPFELVGRIDRIDHHPEQGYRLMDYKTADTGNKPEKTHLVRTDGGLLWVELQLPLYRLLAPEAGVPLEAELQTGYFNLPKSPEDTRFEPLSLEPHEQILAEETSRQVIRNIRAGHFWPPGDPPLYEDGLSFLAGDRVSDRASHIARSSQVLTAGRAFT